MGVSFREEFRCRKFLFEHTQLYLFVRSQWRIPHWLYVSWRLFWAGWNFAWIVYSINLTVDAAPYPGAGAKWLIYLTNLSYLLLTVQSILHAVTVVSYMCPQKNKGSLESIQGSIPWYLKPLWLLTSVVFNTAIIVTVLYWSLVFTGELDNIVTVMVHGVNTLYVLTDIFVIATPVRLLHFIYTIIFGGIYIIFTVIYHLAKGTGLSSEPYIYTALDWSKPGPAVGVSLGSLLVALPFIHLLQFGLYTLRIYILEKCRCCTSCAEDDVRCRCCTRKVDSGNEEMVEAV
ncbi:unnamed protein product [Candidula unifasciata]|uniref:Protein rolling stone n=1 Tax=Candidula unifasciata TaxID=100452 RepID=A0A8S3ZZI1_9EUPU|nr:unnamed protein product [Candidula unifasciata]